MLGLYCYIPMSPYTYVPISQYLNISISQYLYLPIVPISLSLNLLTFNPVSLCISISSHLCLPSPSLMKDNIISLCSGIDTIDIIDIIDVIDSIDAIDEKNGRKGVEYIILSVQGNELGVTEEIDGIEG